MLSDNIGCGAFSGENAAYKTKSVLNVNCITKQAEEKSSAVYFYCGFLGITAVIL